MKEKFFLFVLFLLLSMIGICQDSISFPLDIGNKFYYKAGHYPDNGYYGATKTITDIFSDSTRAISFKKYYIDSTTTSQEYWRYSDKKFYISTTTSYFGPPIFDGNLLNDTCTYIGLPSRCYEIFDTTLFNYNYYSQKYTDGFFSHGSGNSIYILTSNNLGVFFNRWYGFGVGINIEDSITLVGFMINGILTGDTVLAGISDPNEEQLPKSFQLLQNYPNPFNPSTTIIYQIPQTRFISLKIYDLLGRKVATLVNEEKPAGIYEVEFEGSGLSSGIYFYKLQTEDYSSIKKMILMK